MTNRNDKQVKRQNKLDTTLAKKDIIMLSQMGLRKLHVSKKVPDEYRFPDIIQWQRLTPYAGSRL